MQIGMIYIIRSNMVIDTGSRVAARDDKESRMDDKRDYKYARRDDKCGRRNDSPR